MNYLVLYKAPVTVRERLAAATPEEAAQGVRRWVDWHARVSDALVYSGLPISRAVRVTSMGSAPTESTVVGISILQAPHLDAALAMVHDHHHLQWAQGCEIELLEEMPVPESGPATDQRA